MLDQHASPQTNTPPHPPNRTPPTNPRPRIRREGFLLYLVWDHCVVLLKNRVAARIAILRKIHPGIVGDVDYIKKNMGRKIDEIIRERREDLKEFGRITLCIRAPVGIRERSGAGRGGWSFWRWIGVIC